MARSAPAHARRRPLCVTSRAVPVGLAAAALAVGGFAPAVAAVARPAPETVREPAPAGGPIELTPRQVEPGTEIRVRVGFCVTERTAMATSVAFEADLDLKRTPDGTAFHGSAMISANAEPGTYGVTVVCGLDARERQGSFKVVPAGDGGPGDHRGDQHVGHRDGDHHDGGHPGRDGHDEPTPRYASPVAPVRAGGGGTAGEGAAGGADTAQRAGLTMAAGAAVAGAGAWAVRRRRAGVRAGG